MMKTLRVRLANRLMGKLWAGFRTHIESCVVPGGGGVIFMGDSLTHFAKLDLLFPGVRALNFGIGGERADHLLQRLDPVIAQKPEKLFLLIGSNDTAAGFTAQEVVTSIAALLDRVARELPQCRVVLQGVMPRECKHGRKLALLNDALRALASQRGIPFVELYDVMDDGTGTLRADYTWDGIHFNGAGYLAWRGRILPHL